MAPRLYESAWNVEADLDKGLVTDGKEDNPRLSILILATAEIANNEGAYLRIQNQVQPGRMSQGE